MAVAVSEKDRGVEVILGAGSVVMRSADAAMVEDEVESEVIVTLAEVSFADSIEEAERLPFELD